MTRREEMERQAEITVFPWDEPQEQNKFQDGFIEGAKWADKTMIEKVCEWFQCMALDYMQGDITDVKWGSMFADLRNYIENGDD